MTRSGLLSSKTLLSIAVSMLTAWFPVQAATEVIIIDTHIIKTFLTGSIDQSDAEHYESLEQGVKMINETTKKPVAVSIELNSSGGDVTSAMRIGQVLRRIKALASVKNEATCLSACTFVLAGAGYRAVEERARIGIHRPYQVDSEDSSPETERSKYTTLQKQVESYLEEMNIAKSLYQDMVRISPQNIRFLSWTELERYGLGHNDPFFEEADELKKAKSLGISRQELAKRRSREFGICGGWPDFSNESEFKRRFECRERVVSTGK